MHKNELINEGYNYIKQCELIKCLLVEDNINNENDRKLNEINEKYSKATNQIIKEHNELVEQIKKATTIISKKSDQFMLVNRTHTS